MSAPSLSSRQTNTAACLVSRAMLEHLGRLWRENWCTTSHAPSMGSSPARMAQFDWALFQGEHFTDLIKKFPETFPTHFAEPFECRRMHAGLILLMGLKSYEVGFECGDNQPLRASALHRGAALELVRHLKAEQG